MLEKIKMIFKNFILWIVSIFFILTFIVYIKEIPIPSIGILIAGIMLLPPINNKIKTKLQEKGSKYVVIKNIFISMLFLIFLVNISSSSENIKADYNNIINENQIQNVGNSVNLNNFDNENISSVENVIEKENQNITNNVDNQNVSERNEVNNTKELTNNTNIVSTNESKNTSEAIQQQPKQNNYTKQENIKNTTQSKNTSAQKNESTKGTSSSNTLKSNILAKNITDSSRTVYITPTGKRYHYRSTCGGKNSTSTTLNNAKARGLTPCKKCAQ